MPGVGAGINAGFAYVELRLSDTDYISGPLKRQTEDAAEEASQTLRERLTEGVKNAAEKASAGMDALGVAAGAGLAAGIAEGLDMQAAQSKLQAQLGLTQAESKRIGQVAGDLFASAYGESMEEVNTAIKSVVQNIDGMRDASSAALKDTAKDAINLANVMDEDVSAVTRAVANMLKTGLAKNAKEAFDILVTGVQNGANKSEDLLDTFNEYSIQFKKLGLDGREALGLIQQGLQGGARDADLVADAFKEFSIRATDGSTTSADALKLLGINAKAFTDQMSRGGEGAQRGLQLVLNKLREIQDPVERNAAAVGLFGTQAEDLGDALFKLDPSKAVQGLGDITGAADEMDKALGNNAQTTLTAFKRQMQTNITNVIVAEVLPAIQSFATFLQGMGVSGNNLGQLAVAIAGIGLAWKAVTLAITGTQAAMVAFKAVATGVTATSAALTGFVAGYRNVNLAMSSTATTAQTLGAALRSQILLWRQQAAAQGVSTARVIAHAAAQQVAAAATRAWAAVQAAFNAVMSANPIALVIIAIAALVAAVVIAYRESETFRNIVNAAWAGIQQGLQVLWGVVQTVWTAIWGTIQTAWNGYIRPVFAAIWTFITGTLVPIFQALWQAVQVVWTGIQTAINIAWGIIQGVWNAIGGFIRTILVPVFQLIQFQFELVWFAVRTAAILAWRIIEGIWALIKIYIDTVLLPVFRLIRTVFELVWNAIEIAAKAAWDFIKPIWDVIWNFIKDYLIFYFNALRIGAQESWQLIQAAIKGAWDFIKPIFDGLVAAVKVIVDAFQAAVGLIAKAWDGIKDATKKPVEFVINTVYRDGIKAVWDKVADIVKLPHMPDPPAFARGGIMPGYAPGKDSLFAHVSPGEAIMRPEFTKAVGSGWIHRMNYMARTGRSDDILKAIAGVGDPGGVPGFAGSFGIGGIVGDFLDSAKGFFAGGFMKIAQKTFDGILGDAMDAVGGTPWGQMMVAVPKMLINKVLEIFKENENKVGGSIASVNAIRSQIGTPYSWGGGGPYGPTRGIEQGAKTVGYDCSSLMQYGEYQAFKQVIPRTTYTQKSWLTPIDAPIPGAIGQPHPGHTYMATEKGTIVEAPFTGGFVREVPMRAAPFWGLPPYRATADTGSQLMPGLNPPIYNGTGQPEPILNPRQMSIVERSLDLVEREAQNVDNRINVYPQRAEFTLADLEALEARRNALSRVGRPK